MATVHDKDDDGNNDGNNNNSINNNNNTNVESDMQLHYMFGAGALVKVRRRLTGMRLKCDHARNMIAVQRNKVLELNDLLAQNQGNWRKYRDLVDRKTELERCISDNVENDKFQEFCLAIQPLLTFLLVEQQLHEAAQKVFQQEIQIQTPTDNTQGTAIAIKVEELQSLSLPVLETTQREEKTKTEVGTVIIPVALTRKRKAEQFLIENARKKMKAEDLPIGWNDETNGIDDECTKRIDQLTSVLQTTCLNYHIAQTVLQDFVTGSEPSNEWKLAYGQLRRSAIICVCEIGLFQRERSTPVLEDIYFCSNCKLPLFHCTNAMVCGKCGIRETADEGIGVQTQTEAPQPYVPVAHAKSQLNKFRGIEPPEEDKKIVFPHLERALRLNCFTMIKKVTTSQVRACLIVEGLNKYKRYTDYFCDVLNGCVSPVMTKEQSMEIVNVIGEVQQFLERVGIKQNNQPIVSRYAIKHLAATKDPAYLVFVNHHPLPRTSHRLEGQLALFEQVFKQLNLSWIPE